MSVQFTSCYPVLPVRDLVQSQAYYRDVLRFQIDWRDANSFGQVSSGDIALFFQKNPEPVPSCTVVLNCENADVVHEALQQAGAEIIDPIATRPWGLREFRVRDLNGHVLRISHVDESQSDYSSFDQNPE